ncbi:MAG: N-6 DNA methylase [Candidatus Paceibacterota bacterium]|jgi:adenine-specific DNA-methyltransferase
MINQKKNGSYYTPEIISNFIVKRIFNTKHYSLPNEIKILEPSVGDGIFVSSLIKNNKNNKKITLEIVEREESELKKSIIIPSNFKDKDTKIIPHLIDYLEFEKNNSQKYDLVIGNPPYIKKNHLTKKQLDLCEKIHAKANLSNKKIKNVWTAFLIGSVESLNDNGIVSFVLPAELLQVSYAKEIRDYLRKKLNKIEIFAFNELVFDGIEQDVIIIIGTKSSKNKEVSFFQANRLDDLKKPDLIPGNTNIDRDTLDKWTNYILSQKELSFLDKFKKDLLAIKDYSKVQVGIVTAANDFFIINKTTADKFNIKKYCKPILQKSSFIPTSLIITRTDFSFLKERDKPVFLLSLEDKSENYFPKKIKKYIKLGENNGVNNGYKCKIRNNWFHVSSIWPSEGFFIKRSNFFPRIVVNDAKVNVTDAFYRIMMKDGYDIKNLSFCFLNTLSLIFTELEGRYYGGGVLELIPNEFKNIPVPYIKINQSDFNKLDTMLRNKESKEDILNFTDNVILKKNLKLSKKDIVSIKNIYQKLVNRRLKVDIRTL